MKSTNKYPYHQSPFFRLRSKQNLAKLLGLSLRELKSFSGNELYKTWVEPDGRAIQAPTDRLKRVHKRVKNAFARIETPEWLISGVRGKSIVDNARIHQRNSFLLNVDIQGFYKSTTVERLAQVFIYHFKMAHDIAFTLANILTWNGLIPTGSPASQLMAYWANHRAFHQLADMARERGWAFSVYVDDLSFSSCTPIPKDFPHKIQNTLSGVGLKLKKKKTKFYIENDFKVVTGVGITSAGVLAVPNRLRKKIVDAAQTMTDNTSAPSERAARSLTGLIVSAQQIESNLFDSTRKQISKKR